MKLAKAGTGAEQQVHPLELHCHFIEHFADRVLWRLGVNLYHLIGKLLARHGSVSADRAIAKAVHRLKIFSHPPGDRHAEAAVDLAFNDKVGMFIVD